MARTRSIRNQKRRERKPPMEIDITSLLDILVILLVFLLKSYNSSGVTVDIPKEIKLPSSDTQDLNNAGVMIQVSKNKIWVDLQTILDLEEKPTKIYDQGNRRIISLYDVLVKKRDEINNLNRQVPEATKFTGIANLIIDKTIKYSYVKKIMYTCASAGFQKYKFVVLGEDG